MNKSLFKTRFSFLLYIIGALIWCLSAASAAGNDSTFVYSRLKLWQVFSNGVIEPLSDEFNGGEEINHVGTTSPVVSPDHNLMAYTKDNDLWILNLRDNTRSRLTRSGRLSTTEFASVYVLISDWSFDNKKILYYLNHSETQDPDGNEPEREIRPVGYGFRIYDLENRTTTPVKLPSDYEAWLPNGDFLLTSAEPEILDQHLLIYKSGEEFPRPLSPLRGWWGQSNINPNGRTFLISLSQTVSENGETPQQQTSRIVKFNLKNGAMLEVSPTGSWAEFQQPAFSPSTKRVAYIQQQEPDQTGYSKGNLIVDGKTISGFTGSPFSFRWINDKTIVLIEENSLVVISADDGHEIGHKKFDLDNTPLQISEDNHLN